MAGEKGSEREREREKRRGGCLMRQRLYFFFSRPAGLRDGIATEPAGSEFSALGDQRVRVQTSVMRLAEDKDFKFHKNAVVVLCNR